MFPPHDGAFKDITDAFISSVDNGEKLNVRFWLFGFFAVAVGRRITILIEAGGAVRGGDATDRGKTQA